MSITEAPRLSFAKCGKHVWFFSCATQVGGKRKKSMFSDRALCECRKQITKKHQKNVLYSDWLIFEAEHSDKRMMLWSRFPPYLSCHSVSVTRGVSLSLPPALAPWISTGSASLPGDNNPKCLPQQAPQIKMRLLYNPGWQSSVECCYKVRWALGNLVDGWTEWEGTPRGESVGFHRGTRWLLLFSAGPCSHIKKAERRSQL